MVIDLKRVPKGERAAVKRLTRQSEADFQAQIIELAQLYGWLVHAERPARRQDGRWETPIQGHAGFPDLVLLKGRTLLFWELKVAKRKLSPSQDIWGMCLERFNKPYMRGRLGHVEYHVWRPSDWAAIEAVLGGSR